MKSKWKKEKQRKTNQPCQARPLWSHFPPHQLISWTMQKLPADFIWSFWHSSHNCCLNCHRHHYHRAPTLRQSISCVVICRSRLRPCLPSKKIYSHSMIICRFQNIHHIFISFIFSDFPIFAYDVPKKLHYYLPYFSTIFANIPAKFLLAIFPHFSWYASTIFAY